MPAAEGARGSTQRQHAERWLALRLALVYAVVAGLWILLSDRALEWLNLPRDAALRIASFKGMGFVAVTAALLFILAFGFIRRLHASQEQYAHLFDNAVEGLVVFRGTQSPDGSPDLEIVDLNPAAEQRTGLLRDEAVGRLMSRSDGLDERTLAYFEVVAAAVRGGAAHYREIDIEADGAHELVQAYAIAEGRWAVSALDLTERRAAEQELRRSRQEYQTLAGDLERRVAQRTAQLEATNGELESFAYSISHDLRSPLRALDGFSEILLQDYGPRLDDAGRDYLRRIKGAANHMAGLMDGLLQLSRLNREELAFREVDLGAMAASTVAELREHDPTREVIVDIAPDLVAQADPKLMRSVLVNLLGNAWKFTSRHDHAHIEVGAEETDGGRAFFIRDDGAGFDMRYAENLFGAFQRLHTPEQFEGTGIGLATVQRIVHRHGGTLWAKGEVENGATFWFTLEPNGEG